MPGPDLVQSVLEAACEPLALLARRETPTLADVGVIVGFRLSVEVPAHSERQTRGRYDQGYGELETGCRSPVAKRSKRNG